VKEHLPEILEEALKSFGDDEHSDQQTHQTHLLPPPTDPMAVANSFIRGCTHKGLLTLRRWRGGWWMWRTTHWVEVEEHYVRSILYRFTEHAFYVAGLAPAPWAPTRKRIGDLLDALSAICILQNEIDQPSWLDDTDFGVVVSVRNGLLDVESRRLIEHTPAYFNQTSVPFDYLPKAATPQRWLQFLGQLWPDEKSEGRAEIDVLGEWFGYVVSGRTNLHKILLMIGPTRAGKGVIAHILTAMIGRKNVAGPTLNSLSGEFGLAPLIGKPLAIISDARFAGKDASVVVERLLSISGEDTLTVNRKYRDQWTGKLPSRLHVLSNELPKLGDASTAIVGRIVLLLLSRSWLGKEDHELVPTLQQELTGILNWSLDGLQRLVAVNKGRFTQVASADDAITTMRDLASPVAAFVRECCVVGPDKEIAIDDMYIAYKSWAEQNGHAKKSKSTFGRDLRAAVPSISRKRPRDQSGEATRPRHYVGIDLQRFGTEAGQ